MSYSDTKTQPRPIAEIVRFLVDMVVGNIEGANHWHRLEATRQLERLGLQIPNAVKQAVSPPANGQKPERAPGKPQPKDELAEIIREETDGGRDIVRFLIDAMQGKLEGFKPRHLLTASDRLITRGFDNALDHTGAGDAADDGLVSHEQPANRARRNTRRYNDDDAPFDFDTYSVDDYKKDRMGLRAEVHIFGSEEAREVAFEAVRKYKMDKTAGAHSHGYDYSTAINPEDDPYGKGCYGRRVLWIEFEDHSAIRVANKAVAEYHKRKYKHLLNEDGSLIPHADSESLSPHTLQYLERNSHLLAHNDDKPPEDPYPPDSVTPDQPQNTRADEGFKPSRDPQGPPTPTPPPRKKRLNIHLGPTSEDNPPDDDSRQRGDPDEIRVPLKDLVSISPVHL